MKTFSKLSITFFSLAIIAILSMCFSNEASASHFRYGHLTFTRDPQNCNIVTFTLTNAFRRNGYAPNNNVGNQFTESIGNTSLIFGDGTPNTGTLRYRVIAVDVPNNFLIARALQPGDTSKQSITHTYTASGPFLAEINATARTTVEINHPNQGYRVSTLLYRDNCNNSPISSLPVIVNLVQGDSTTFTVPGFNSDPNKVLRWRYATVAEMGVTGTNPPAAFGGPGSIDPFTGVVTWNTTTAVIGGLYSCQIILEQRDLTTDTVKTRVAVDFLSLVLPPCIDSIAPVFVPPTPTCDTVIVADTGVAITFTVQAQDDGTRPITLNAAGLPPGATMTPQLPTTGNPVSSVFNWTPSVTGGQVVSFIATDSCGNQTICVIQFDITSPCPDTIAPVFIPPTPICNDVITGDTGVAITFTVQAQDNSTGPIILNVDSLPPGATMTPPLPTTGNPVSSVFNWTPPSYGGQSVTFTATDSCGNQTTCRIVFDVPLPVELTSFTSFINNNEVTLNWSTATESNNSRFEIERANGNSQEWNMVGTIQGNGNSTQPISYSLVDRGLNVGSYNYRLKQIDFNGNFTYHNLSNEVIIGVPTRFNLSQNYPNPFNPSTKIDFEIPKDGNVNLYVYDNTGKQVSTLVSEFRTAGYYTVQFNALNLASGIYYYKIQYSGDQSFEKVMKMALLK
ncbi:MAG: T9SS type A sorting domain-containing protein [Bacteroidota bacterium]|nr:T9SS type A sorting domain-containing protein [Bacteroidota bacterium]